MQQQELGKEWEDREEEGLCEERRPASLLGTEFQLRQVIGALQIKDHKIEALLEKILHRQERQDKPRRTPSQKKESERREWNVLRGREQERHAPWAPRLAPLHGL